MAWTKPVKGVVKAPQPILVVCRLRDCIFHEGSPDGDPDLCRCSHLHRPKEGPTARCMLYQVDFQKKLGALNRNNR